MYWLLDYADQEDLRQTVIKLQTEIMQPRKREQVEQIFPFIGRKSRAIASTVIENLAPQSGVVCDPFCGSGTFLYAAQDNKMKIWANEWEPYAFRMMKAPLMGVPSEKKYNEALQSLLADINPMMKRIYGTSITRFK